MAGELEFGALHNDDRILDALAERSRVDSDDAVVNLLAALAADVDSRPVPIADVLAEGLLARPVAAARTETAAVSAGAQSAAAGGSAPSETLVREREVAAAAPPVPLAPVAARRRPRMLPRAAATAGIAAVVLGAGGVAAAVGGGGSPFDGIRRVVGNVIEPVAPSPSRQDREDKASRLLDQAQVALQSSDTAKAAELLSQAKSQLSGLKGSVAGALTDKLEALQSRLANLRAALGQAVGSTGTGVVGNRGGTHPGGKQSGHLSGTAPTQEGASQGTAPFVPAPLGESPTDSPDSPADARSDGITHDLPGPDIGNPADQLPGSKGQLPAEGKIGEAERDVQDKAGAVPVPGPDEVDTPVGPVHPVSPLRTPSTIDMFDDPSVHQVVIDVAPTAGSAANGLTGDGNP